MGIFEIIGENSNSTPKAPKRNENHWVKLGVEFSQARKKGVTSKQFAEEKGIIYSTFTKAMSRYSSRIKVAVKVAEIEKKPINKMTRQERALVMVNSFRSSLKDKIRNEGAAVNNKSAKWFAETIKKNIRSHLVSKPTPGKLYAYVYDAKHKDTLPFWDRYPLIIYLGLGKQGNTMLMYGLNLHYIPPKARQQFLEELLKQYANTPVLSNKTKLKINWSKVKGFQGADKMIKAYLPGNIKGSLAEIKPADWANVVMLPLQNFQSKGKRFAATSVWKS